MEKNYLKFSRKKHAFFPNPKIHQTQKSLVRLVFTTHDFDRNTKTIFAEK